MALAAVAEVFVEQSITLKDIEFRKALFLPEGETVTIQTIFSGGADGMAPFHIYSCAEGAARRGRSWTLHALGKVCLQQETGGIVQNAEQETLAEIRIRCAETIDGPDYYRGLSENGIHYGPFFQSIARLWQNNGDDVG